MNPLKNLFEECGGQSRSEAFGARRLVAVECGETAEPEANGWFRRFLAPLHAALPGRQVGPADTAATSRRTPGRGRCVASCPLVLVACWLVIAPSRATAQAVSPWPGGLPPPPFLQGPTLRDTMRNGAQAASDQAGVTAQFAREMGGRARSAAYQMQNLWTDYQNLAYKFQHLRVTFNALGELALQLQSPRAANAAAELQAGLSIISEAFDPVQQEMQTGTLNRDTVLRMCQVLNEALLEWQKELKRCSTRLGTIR